MKKVTFTSKPEFFTVLKAKVDDYFSSTGKTTKGTMAIRTKSTLLLTLLCSTYTLLLVYGNNALWIMFSLYGLLGIIFASIGFNIMHDAVHESYSKNNKVNKLMGYSLNVMGGSEYFWRHKHNINHHTYTNIEGMDEDIDILGIRTSTQQPLKKVHTYQHFYCWAMYVLTYLSWIWFEDFKKYFSGKIGVNHYTKMSLAEEYIFLGTKVFYLIVFIIIPFHYLGWWSLAGYGVLCLICGLIIATIFQLAHIVQGVTNPVPNQQNQIENEWAIHQVQTTADFATNNKFISWFAGGLNYQVIHHLFPRISHIHYPKIQPLVKETCKEFGIKYNENATLMSAIISHIKQLKQFGQPHNSLTT